MTPFNPKNKKNPTVGELLDPAMHITDPEDAKQYLAAYVKMIQKGLDKTPNSEGLTAEQIAKSNLGYFAGYYSNETCERVEKLFMCEHPVFGSIEKNGAPGNKKAFEMGLALGKKMKEAKA